MALGDGGDRVVLWRPFAAVAALAVVAAIATRPAGCTTLVRSKTIVNVGGVGSYDEVVAMPCGIEQQQGGGICQKRPKPVAGCLAPFDEEQTLKLRGPMTVSAIAVYYPSGGTWNRVSHFDRNSGSTDNIVFLGDYGRAWDGASVDEEACWSPDGQNWKMIVNGDDFLCHGYNQSYVSADGKCARRSPEAFSGSLADHVQVNVMQATKCDPVAGDCGFFRGVGHHGWAGSAGGGKMFAVKAMFPTGELYDSPALWFLHASVVRSANHHTGLCNCRGVGSPGGCGELDIAEVVEEQDRKQDVDTTMYSFKGVYSDQTAYSFERPTSREVVFLTIFNPEGYVQVLEMDDGFDFGSSIPAEKVEEWNGRRELIIKMPGEMPAGCGGPVCSYPSAGEGDGFAARVDDGVQCIEETDARGVEHTGEGQDTKPLEGLEFQVPTQYPLTDKWLNGDQNAPGAQNDFVPELATPGTAVETDGPQDGGITEKEQAIQEINSQGAAASIEPKGAELVPRPQAQSQPLPQPQIQEQAVEGGQPQMQELVAGGEQPQLQEQFQTEESQPQPQEQVVGGEQPQPEVQIQAGEGEQSQMQELTVGIQQPQLGQQIQTEESQPQFRPQSLPQPQEQTEEGEQYQMQEQSEGVEQSLPQEQIQAELSRPQPQDLTQAVEQSQPQEQTPAVGSPQPSQPEPQPQPQPPPQSQTQSQNQTQPQEVTMEGEHSQAQSPTNATSQQQPSVDGGGQAEVQGQLPLQHSQPEISASPVRLLGSLNDPKPEQYQFVPQQINPPAPGRKLLLLE